MYVGRFAPSPTGPLHAGSLVAALASWLDARAHSGRWLIRIEDIDAPRCVPGGAELILNQLAACGMHPDEPPVRQSLRGVLYQQALDELVVQRLAYPCACSRKEIEQAQAARGVARLRGGELPYPGTCRPPQNDTDALLGRQARAWRFHSGLAARGLLKDGLVHWHDRRLGAQQQHVESAVGDFVLKRADGLWAYQLAVVVDDSAQSVTHIVRGQDLADNTPRQILLQQALGQATPTYLHTPLVMATDGEKLSKQNGAQALDLTNPLRALTQAAEHLGLAPSQAGDSLVAALSRWTREWAEKYAATSTSSDTHSLSNISAVNAEPVEVPREASTNPNGVYQLNPTPHKKDSRCSN
ncbi:tRNA glutamyl-Q(34) synthetase GluQRS [Ottowia thiooxydans]|uniref:tRNA glutamyl-Q(34) synthetase GluQRS n=1 Tax=Ottowia thiooxydans TaxID=219182 RepID=UPI000A04E955|nr:tRNA glutamyl-Q(34) synthetase GluQRS [Ottowia thiooxydans]